MNYLNIGVIGQAGDQLNKVSGLAKVIEKMNVDAASLLRVFKQSLNGIL